VGVALLRVSATRRPAALASLRPHLGVPPEARSEFLTAAPVLFAVWALAGFYGSLGPALSGELANSTSVALGGVGLFILAGVASLTTVVLRAATGRAVMTTGIVTLIGGIAGSVVAIRAGSVACYFAATAVAGVGSAAGSRAASAPSSRAQPQSSAPD
jgi:hypothetical protein